MRRAIADADVGDEQKREDPTVIALEERAAELLGQEEAVFLPTATMANQIALRTLTEPGDEVLAEEMAHVFRYELGGPAVHSGLVMKSLPTAHGIFTAEDVREAVNPPGDLHTAPTRLVCIENTHNGGGGQGLAARASPGGGRRGPGARALGAPRRRAADERRGRERDSGGGVWARVRHGHALPLQRARLPARSGHRRVARSAWRRRGATSTSSEARCARRGSWRPPASTRSTTTSTGLRRTTPTRAGSPEGLAEAGLPVEVDQVETNFVQLDAARLGLGADEAVARLRAEGVLLSFAARKDVLRAVTHLDISADDIDEAIAGTVRAFSGSQRPVELAGDAPTPY